MSEPPGDNRDDRDERIRLLEYQVAFLHRELTFVTKRYHAILYSAAWTIARPIKRLEDAGHRVARSLRKRGASAKADPAPAPDVAGGDREAQIATRIAAKMVRPAADR